MTKPVFRALAIASLVGRWPKLATEVEDSAAAAATPGITSYSNSGAAIPAAEAATDSAAATYGVTAAEAIGEAAIAATMLPPNAFAASGAATVLWATVSSDASALENGASHGTLSATALWPDGAGDDDATSDDGSTRSNMPGWAATAWAELKAHLLSTGEGWEVWTDWYDARLEGRFGPQVLELARVTIPDEDWKKGPAHVNAIIKRLIEKHEARRRDASPLELPRHQPPPGPEPGPHDYDPAMAGLAELTVVFEGDVRDERVEAELSRFATLLRRRLLDATARRTVPLVLGNNMQVDYLSLHRVNVAPGSVDSHWIVTLTVVSMLWGMAATYSDVKEGLTEIRADVEWALSSATEAFTSDLPEDAPLQQPRRDLVFRNDNDVLADLLDKERQPRMRGPLDDDSAGG